MSRFEIRDVIADVPQALRTILDPNRGAVQPPVRSEIFGSQRFSQHGRSLAETHRAGRARFGAASFFPRIQDNIQTLREAYRYIGLQASTGYDISPAAEWLLDNFHVIEAQTKEIHEGLPRGYFRNLPMLLDEPLAGLPRIYGVAWAFVAHTDGAFDGELLVDYLRAYQEIRELRLCEMWAFPITLRVVLVENLRRLAEHIATSKAAREVANLCFDRIETLQVSSLEQVLGALNQRGVGSAFLSQIALRAQDRHGHGEARKPTHFEDWLRSAIPDLSLVQTQQSVDQAADNLSVSNAVISLRAIGDADWTDIIAHASALMQRMLTVPTFEAEDTRTRDQSLHAIEALAQRSGLGEVAVARTLIEVMGRLHGNVADSASSAARHWLCGAGRPVLLQALDLREEFATTVRRLLKPAFLPAYLFSLAGLLGLIVAGLLFGADAHTGAGWSPAILLVAVLMAFPASETAVAVINRLISESIRPQFLPRLALVDGIPPQHRTMVVIPGMFSSDASVQALVHRIELHYLANPEVHVQFALLTDWADCGTAQAPSDTGFLAAAQDQIRALNARHGPAEPATGATLRFLLLHREREFCDSEQRWIGWERKRGKLELLVAELATAQRGAFMDLGEIAHIAPDTRYIVTLDSDTQLPPGRLRELVGIAAHPHNQPQMDAAAGSVLSGYGILQPRVVTPLPDAQHFTLFHWLFAGQCGIDPYSAASSEVYQDLFAEGTFMGKGLLHVRAVHAVLSGRLPLGQVLSHDLLEGAIARCAAVTDVTVIEDAPFHADVAASRVHRWTRGDWQLLPFLLGSSRYRLRAINRWKMLDNLRRSLVAPMSTALLLVAMAGFGVSVQAALTAVIAAFVAGPLLGAIAGFAPSRDDIAKRHFFREAAVDLVRVALAGVWHVAMLLHHALMAIDAIARAIYRSTVSRRQLLQWTTADAAQAQVRFRLPELLHQHQLVPFVALLLCAAVFAIGTPTPLLTPFLCLIWGASPLWTWWVSRAQMTGKGHPVGVEETAYLEGVGRDTWRLFERCVTPQDHHLPPDNLQRSPHDMLAHRTSPTNIGLYLLSVACARQFGWIGTEELLGRLEDTLASMDKLLRHRGHFLNWYDTQTGAPLLPMYVSTVDSGNLSGHLLAVAQACLELTGTPHAPMASRRAMEALKMRMAPLLEGRHTLDPAGRQALKWLLADHRATRKSARRDALADAAVATQRLLELAQRLQSLAAQADFSFLYHPKRHLFHIGYRVAEQQSDAGFYDLLASESRLTSLWAVAKGDVPVRHWAALGRPFFAVGTTVGLRSWSGSMFEYLMPGLVLGEPQGSVLRTAGQAALCEHMAFAKALGIPWGISESAYAACDHTLAYQYAPQGVPRLALRRTPPDELVVAPYATALAAQIAPHRATANFRVLQAMGARGRYGFIDALDFTVARRTGDEAFTPVETFMAHHQGMSIVALANCLLEGAAQRWGMANVQIEAVASLLHERVPREVSMLNAPPPGQPLRLKQRRRTPGLLREVVPGATALEPTHLLSNGRYTVALRANGSGWSKLGPTAISRQHDDALRDDRGSFMYVSAFGTPSGQTPARPVSVTQHPAPDPAADYGCVYHSDRVCFQASWPHLQVHTTVWVSPEDDVEFRQVELRNLGEHPLDLELASVFEVTLSEPRADASHPAFANLFVKAHWLSTHLALLFERKPRLPAEADIHMAHFLAESDSGLAGVRIQTDRQQWLGRNHRLDQPQAKLDAVPEGPSGSPSVLETGLDPVCALAVRIQIAPGAKSQLTFATAASQQSTSLRSVIDKYRMRSHVKRASLMSATMAGIRLRALRMSAENFSAMQSLTTSLVLSLTRPQHPTARTMALAPSMSDARLLWRMGISGDRPILLVLAGVPQGIGLLRALAQALSLWSWAGVECDLVVVNAEPASYQMELRSALRALCERHAQDSAAQGAPGCTSFHVLPADELSDREMDTLHARARVHLHADGRPLVHHVQEWVALHEEDLQERQNRSAVAVASGPATRSAAAVPRGDFVSHGGFEFDTGAGLRPARPWINVLANPDFGAHISETGGGYTWATNSRMNQLTAWSNDPVADTPVEWFLLQDRRTREIWSVAPSAWGDSRTVYHVLHDQGTTSISHRRGDLEVSTTWCVDAASSVKAVTVRLWNCGRKALGIRLAGMVEWQMGANPADRMTVHTALHHRRLVDRTLTALLCTQREAAAGFGGGTAFFAMGATDHGTADWTCDRREFFDARGCLIVPDHWGQRSGEGLDPCAALSTVIDLPAGASSTHTFLLGYAQNEDAARQLAAVAVHTAPDERITRSRQQWDALLGATTVKTPDPLFDAMVNRWLLYQTVACRLWAKAGLYQAGGATGFRDQLQDTMALAWAAPSMLRKQIVLCASRQFPAGDVQHWWHAPAGSGVRTHFSDDLLWLPYALVHYLKTTADTALLDQNVAFIEGADIPDGADDAYFTPTASALVATVYEHAARTLDRSLRVGAHGLPLMGSGDWNDGMNRIGSEGRGESVWLGWFLCQLVAEFSPVARARGDMLRGQQWESAASGWKTALLGPAWDGQWFRRAFFDDGSALGSQANPEAQIDLIAQTWSVLSGVAPASMQNMAMAAVASRLVDANTGLIQLLAPPLVNAVPSAGYIQSYPPGVRENAGQYSHAGAWAVMAAAQLARTIPDDAVATDTPYRYFTYLSAAHRAAHPTCGQQYGLEPYVMAGDVYSQPPYTGRGGWSWYTGSAAWMHRAAIESIFGLQLGAAELSFLPCLPSHWNQAELTLVRDGRTMRFILLRAHASMAPQEAACRGALLLRPGESLAWPTLPVQNCYVIPLLTPSCVSAPTPLPDISTVQP